jgi:hypothetical protein
MMPLAGGWEEVRHGSLTVLKQHTNFLYYLLVRFTEVNLNENGYRKTNSNTNNIEE